MVIGSGMGGGTLTHALAATGARILLLERGDFIPQEPENWSSRAVWQEARYRTPERWLDGAGREFRPYTHYCVGGNSKFWGSVLYRLRREDFGELQHKGGDSPAWPITYEVLAPYYERAERLYSVHGDAEADPTEPPRTSFPHPPVPHEDRMALIVERLRSLGLHPSHLPLGLQSPGEEDGCVLCGTCASFPCRIRRKSDADVCAVSPALGRGNVTLWTHACAHRLVSNARGDKIIAAEVSRQGKLIRVEAPLFVVSCGAVNSAALLLRSATRARPQGLANSSGLLGRNYMAHLSTMIGAFMPPRHDTTFQKTVAVNDFYLRGPDSDYPLGQIQSQGRSNAVIVKAGGPPMARWIPTWAFDIWFSRSVEWLAMTEDLPSQDNRVTVTDDGRTQLRWKPRNALAHKQLVALTGRMLRGVGCWQVVPVSLGLRNTTHQCGTAVFGTDPRRSVLDPWCRAHDVDNLFVVDASFFPSSAAVNPALTIAAQALRAADHIRHTHLR
ncbi:MAG: GMC family oxidoreductase [Gemmatimonadetes bacterium]|nr:GMC family oxidoreductase [Gemmatimonadota bacterium]